MNIHGINNTKFVQNFKANPKANVKTFLRCNENLSQYAKEYILSELKGIHNVAKQYKLPVTIAEITGRVKGLELQNELREKFDRKTFGLKPQIENRLLINVGPETRVLDPNEIPLDKISGKIIDFIREVSEKMHRVSKPLSELEKLDYIKEHAVK